jgi:manganese transport protein
LKFTAYRFSWPDILNAQQFNLSGSIVIVAIGAFGITGVASDEIIAYTYWCIEKGYAAYSGQRDDSPGWRRRAQGWINVMYLDASVAMILYTSVTAAFYLLGAAVLHQRGEIPDESHLVETLALIYTQSLGPGSRIAFLIGGFFVLYSSLFATLASWSRVFPDLFGQFGWIDFHDVALRKKLIAVLSWGLPVIWTVVYLFIHLPLMMILSGGVVGSVLLFLVVFGALNFRYRRQQLSKPGIIYDTAFWISIISIVGIGIYGIVKIF